MESREIQKIANLSKLIIEKDREEEFISKLQSVMKMIDQLKEVDCSQIAPLSSVCEMNLRMRDDVVNDVVSEVVTSFTSFAVRLLNIRDNIIYNIISLFAPQHYLHHLL